jgi:hypothetical protein
MKIQKLKELEGFSALIGKRPNYFSQTFYEKQEKNY